MGNPMEANMMPAPAPKTVENGKSMEEQFALLSQRLSAHLDTKAFLVYGQYAARYGMSPTNLTENNIIDAAHHDDDEVGAALTELFNKYKENNQGQTKYHEAEHEKETNATSQRTIDEAGFIVRDFLEDMKNTAESKG